MKRMLDLRPNACLGMLEFIKDGAQRPLFVDLLDGAALGYARAGVDLDRSTMARWIGACGALLRPLVEALRRYVLAPGKVHADDLTSLSNTDALHASSALSAHFWLKHVLSKNFCRPA